MPIEIQTRVRAYTVKLLCALALVCISEQPFCQEPNDCEGAVVICDNGPVAYNPNGPGNVDFTTGICPTTEHQSAWYYFAFDATMPPNQILTFTITPNPISDYDFAMWGPDVDCADLDLVGMIRCNFSPQGITGLNVGGVGAAFEEALTVNPGEGYYLMVDHFSSGGTPFSIDWGGSAAPFLDCTADPTCDLEVDAGMPVEICEGEEFTLSGVVGGIIGTVIYDWQAEPASGNAFITDPSSLTTTVNIPTGTGQDFIFTLFVTDDECEASDTVSATLLPLTTPTFSFNTELCADDDPLTFPTTSTNGITGVWNPSSIEPAITPGITRIYFSPIAGQAGCVDTTSLLIIVSPVETPQFNIPLVYCASDPVIFFPTTSLNGINGNWTPNSVDPSQNINTSVTSTFVASDPGCFEDYTLTISILPDITPVFQFDPILCETDAAIVLPLISIDGIAGTWSMPIIDPSGQGGNTLISIFTPDVLMTSIACYLPLVFTWSILEPEDPEFPPFPTLCTSDPVLVLPTEASGGQYTGTWTPTAIDPSLGPGTYTASFTPDAVTGNCVNGIIATFVVEEEAIPEFQPITVCETEIPFALPNTSINGIMGTWNPAVIDPANQGGNQISSTFTPDAGICAATIDLVIDVTELENPIFNLPTNLCELDAPIPLNNTSINGISGTWSVPEINPSGQGGGPIVVTFVPDNNLHPCASEEDFIVDILEAQTPQFNIPLQICELVDPFALPTTSTDGILGSWSIPIIDPNNAVNSIIESVFTPEPAVCVSPFELSIEILKLPTISDLDLTNPTDCGIDDGSIRLNSNDLNVFYSFDGGVTWTPNGFVDQLSGGLYTILIRTGTSVNCITQIDTLLTSPGSPLIDEITTAPISDCGLSDGKIFISAEGALLEFSIDNGMTWQSDTIFDNLSAGNYSILTRESNSPSCRTTASVLISSPPTIEIDTVILRHISDCDANDGELVIVASGDMALEYSIDGGTTWSSNSTYSNLSPDTYDIIVRSQNRLNCFDNQSVALTTPMPVEIDDVLATDLLDCQSMDGTISIISSNSGLEYSIDGGVTWQPENIFNNLDAGNYDIVIRRINAVNCLDMDAKELQAPNAPKIDSVIVVQLSDCEANDASAYVYADGDSLEYSIDNGQTWQDDPQFNDLHADSYFILIRSSQSTNCRVSSSFTVEEIIAPIISKVTARNITNCEDANGAIVIEATGDHLEFSIDGINWQSIDSFNSLNGGMYTVIVRNSNKSNCRDTAQVSILDAESPVLLEIVYDTISDCGLTDGRLTLLAAESSSLLEYSIDDGQTWQLGNIFDEIGAGEYLLIVRDVINKNCFDNALLSIEDPSCDCAETFEVSPNGILCYGALSGSISVRPFNPDLNYNIIWNNGSLETELRSLDAGEYSFEITYGNNCAFSDTVLIQQPSELSADLSKENATCIESQNALIEVLNVTGGVGEYQFRLNDGAFQNAPVFSALAVGDYRVEIQDINGCRLLLEETIESKDAIDVDITSELIYVAGDIIELEALYESDEVDSVQWRDRDGRILSKMSLLNTSADENSIYFFTIFYDGCTQEQFIEIKIIEPSIYFPNAFSPNNDGINDVYMPMGSEERLGIDYSLYIYNRWGGIVYQINDASINNRDHGWNGMQSSKSAPEGVYLYRAVINFSNGRSRNVNGEIHLTR